MKMFAFSIRPFDEEQYLLDYCEKYGIEYDYTSETPVLENLEMCRGYDVINILTSPIDRPMIDKLKELGVKLITTRTVGIIHIDYEYAKSVGIGVMNITYSPNTVADYTTMLMLMGLRKVKQTMLRAAAQDYSLKGKLGKELRHCTVGVIGTGKIGRTVIQNLTGFGPKIIAYDPFPNPAVAEMAEYVDLDTLIAESDIITLHAPGVNENYHMIGTEAFKKMKDGVGILNCARGMLLDSDALIENLDSGKVGFACLDTIEAEDGLYYFNRMGEPLDNHKMAILNSYPNVIITPHTAFYTEEAVSQMVENSIINIMNYFEK